MENSSHKLKARDRLTTLDPEVVRRVWRAGVHQTAGPARRQKQASAESLIVPSDSSGQLRWVRFYGGVELNQRHSIGAFYGTHKIP